MCVLLWLSPCSSGVHSYVSQTQNKQTNSQASKQARTHARTHARTQASTHARTHARKHTNHQANKHPAKHQTRKTTGKGNKSKTTYNQPSPNKQPNHAFVCLTCFTFLLTLALWCKQNSISLHNQLVFALFFQGVALA